jgi:mono/diheme cytochrome c family protein
MALYYKFADSNLVTTHLQFMMNRYLQKKVIALFIFLFSLLTAVPAYAFEGNAANGKKLFKQNCAACHKLDKKAIGPALAGVTERRTEEWLLAWIRNNAELRASGDADANAIFKEYNGSVMSAFPNFSDQDIYDILQYTIEGDAPAVVVDGNTPGTVPVPTESPDYVLPMMIILGVLFLLLISLLVKMKNTLRVVQGREPESIVDEVSAFGRALVANKFIMTIGTLGVGVVFLSFTYWYFMGIGVEQNYQPSQPIAFSHKVHAGDNKIDCNYCHSTARHSKHSGIPSANVCMNCHKYIDGSEIKNADGSLKYDGERSPEIAKIYDAIGWDPEAVAFIDNYEQKPIKWVRIHNLPDLAYFNHAQHVNAGQLECQTCHGPVQEMEEVYQYSELTMGWCINCHRETEVQTANGYYEGYADKIKEYYHTDKITVDKIGGMECGKCHY